MKGIEICGRSFAETDHKVAWRIVGWMDGMENGGNESVIPSAMSGPSSSDPSVVVHPGSKKSNPGTSTLKIPRAANFGNRVVANRPNSSLASKGSKSALNSRRTSVKDVNDGIERASSSCWQTVALDLVWSLCFESWRKHLRANVCSVVKDFASGMLASSLDGEGNEALDANGRLDKTSSRLTNSLQSILGGSLYTRVSPLRRRSRE